MLWERVQEDLSHGSVFFDINRKDPARLDVFSAAIRDGRGNSLHRRLFVVQTEMNGSMSVRQPTLFSELVTRAQRRPSLPRTPVCPGLSVLNTPWWRRRSHRSLGKLRPSGKRKPLPSPNTLKSA